MVVTVKPQGREEYALTLDGYPTLSAVRGLGYESAIIPCQMDEWQRESILGATVHVHGTGWRGIVTSRPAPGEPVLARGLGWVGTLGKRGAVYIDDDLSAWSAWESTSTNGGDGISAAEIRGDDYYLGITINVAVGSYANKGIQYYSRDGLTRLTFTWAKSKADTRYGIIVYYGTSEYTIAGSSYSNTGTGESVAVTLPAGTTWVAVAAYNAATSFTPTVPGNGITISGLRVYGTSVTTVNTGNVARDIITQEIDPLWLTQDDAHRAWIASESTAVAPLVFDDDADANTKFETLSTHAAYEYGWYSELVGGVEKCVPHWFPTSTSPDYVLKLSECESVDVNESALDELTSVTRVRYLRSGWRDAYVDVVDTDPTHPLVALGIKRYVSIDGNASGEAVAITLGQRMNAEKGRRQLKGSVTTRKLLTITGAAPDRYAVRPGQVVRTLEVPGGYADAIINRVTLYGDTITLELDNEGYRLDTLLARMRPVNTRATRRR